MATVGTLAHVEGALCTWLHRRPVFVGFVQDAPGSTEPAEEDFPRLPFSL